MSSRRGLGRGLESLIPAEDESDAGLREIAHDRLVPNPHQPRHPFRDQELVELAASIEEHGIIQPLVVTEGPKGRYQIIAGERRWRAAGLAGLTEVPVVIKDVVPREMLELALVENVQREDLNPIEEAMAYQQLIDDFGLIQEEVARRVGKSRSAVTNTLRLLRAAEEVREAVVRGKITEGHARALQGLKHEEEQVEVLRVVLRDRLTVRETETWVRMKPIAAELRKLGAVKDVREALLRGNLTEAHAHALLKLELDAQRKMLHRVLDRDLTVEETKALVQQWLDRQESAEFEVDLSERNFVQRRFDETLTRRVKVHKDKKGWRLVLYCSSNEEVEEVFTTLTGEPLADERP